MSSFFSSHGEYPENEQAQLLQCIACVGWKPDFIQWNMMRNHFEKFWIMWFGEVDESPKDFIGAKYIDENVRS